MQELHTNSQKCCNFASSPFSLFIISLLLLILIYALPCHAQSGIWTETPFNGLQIQYTISGAELDPPSDGGPFCCWDRSFTGKLGPAGSTLSVSGTAIIGSSGGDLSVSVQAGDKVSTYHYGKPVGTGPTNTPFNVSVVIPPGATHGSFSIVLWGMYGNGESRGVRIFGDVDPPAITHGLNGSPGDNKNTVHEGGNGPGKTSCTGLPNYWINTATLNLFVQDRVCMYPGRGPQLAMTHSYNAYPARIGMFGKGWSFAYQYGITKTMTGVSATTATLRKGSGQELDYRGLTDTSPSNFDPPSGNHDKLTWMGDYWLLVEKDTQWTYRFDKSVTGGVTSDTEFRLTSITDTGNNQLIISYTPNNLIQSITDAPGRITTFTYDSSNRVTRMDAPDGRFATYEYDSSGNLAQSVDLLGTQTIYTYDASGLMTSLSAGGKTTQFQYAAVAGVLRISSVTDANGKMTSYSMSGSTVTKTDPLGNNTVYTSTSDSFTSSVTDPLSNIYTTTYTEGNPTSFTDAKGNITYKEYDARGNVTKITDSLGNVSTFAYDPNDNMLSSTNALGEIWTYTYDSGNNLIKIVSPLNNQTVMEYDNLGQMTGITDAAGNKTVFTYNDFGNLASTTDPLRNTTSYTYDAKGINRTSATDARGNRTTFTYDANNRLTGITHPDGTSRSYTYDCCSNTAITDENGNSITFARNPLLNLTKVTDAMGNISESGYDVNSNLSSITDPLLMVTRFTYDAANRLTTAANPLSGSIANTYDPNGNITALKDEMGKQTGFIYDKNNRLLTATDPVGNAVSVTRDPLGRVSVMNKARGNGITTTYDPEGKLLSRTGAGSYLYDALGNLTKLTDATGITTFVYDAVSRTTGITYPDTLSVSFTYDAAGNISGLTYPGGLSASYTYDTRNRLRSVSWGGATTTFTYDNVGNVTGETRPNGTGTVYAYDKNNQLLSIKHSKGANDIATFAYTRDALGNTTAETRTPPDQYTFSDSVIDTAYNDANQIINSVGNQNATYTHDADGNLTAVSGPKSESFTYDELNRLTQMTINGVVTTFKYNGINHRVQAVRNGQTHNYHYDMGGRLLFETDAGNLITAYYLYAGKRLIGMRTKEGNDYFHLFDKTGNTIALTDATGAVASTYTYESFGTVITSTGDIYNPFKYVGAYGVMDEGNGIYFMKHRYYDAATGRFLQKDPIGFAAGQTNLYAYVGGNPVTGIDPMGLFDRGAPLSGNLRDLSKGSKRPAEWTEKDYYNAEATYYVADKLAGAIPGASGIITGIKTAYYFADAALNTGNYKQALRDSLIEIGKWGAGKYYDTFENALAPFAAGLLTDIFSDLAVDANDTGLLGAVVDYCTSMPGREYSKPPNYSGMPFGYR